MNWIWCVRFHIVDSEWIRVEERPIARHTVYRTNTHISIFYSCNWPFLLTYSHINSQTLHLSASLIISSEFKLGIIMAVSLSTDVPWDENNRRSFVRISGLAVRVSLLLSLPLCATNCHWYFPCNILLFSDKAFFCCCPLCVFALFLLAISLISIEWFVRSSKNDEKRRRIIIFLLLIENAIVGFHNVWSNPFDCRSAKIHFNSWRKKKFPINVHWVGQI